MFTYQKMIESAYGLPYNQIKPKLCSVSAIPKHIDALNLV